jgi:hypothetical protein
MLLAIMAFPPDPHKMQPAGKKTAKTGTDEHGKAGPPSGKETPGHDVAKGAMPPSDSDD